MTKELQTIMESFGRLLTVSAYADMVEREECPKGTPGASMGADWMNVTPEGVPREIAEVALMACYFIQGYNRALLVDVFNANVDQEGHLQLPTLDGFGSDLAHECMGSGVGWADDHPEHNLELPRLEVSLYLEEHKKSKLLEQGTPLEDFFWRKGWRLGCEISGPYYSNLRGAPATKVVA